MDAETKGADMVSIERVEQMLDEIAAEFPKAFYEELNGGVMLLPQTKLHPKNMGKDLFILAEYHRDIAMGRYIVFYYGSIRRAFGALSEDALKKQLRETFRHEFTHHLETLSGERGLELEDERQIAQYLKRHRERQ